MNNVEIERKFLVKELPSDLESYVSYPIEQGYLCREPVVRVRRRGEKYTLTYKGGGLMERVEYNLPLTAQAYEHLVKKADGELIRKIRYIIPLGSDAALFDGADPGELEALQTGEGLNIELDIFRYPEGLILAEVEFPSAALASCFIPPSWLGEDVTQDPRYHNSNM